MAKLFREVQLISPNFGTASTWYKLAADIVLLDNSGKTPIRVDKEMCQMSMYTSATQSVIVGLVIHLTDETGASFTGSVVNGTTTDSGIETLMNQWKDNIFMTDFQVLGTGFDEANVFVSNMEADTKRILMPGQKLLATLLVEPQNTETTKQVLGYLDNIVWYSPAAAQ